MTFLDIHLFFSQDFETALRLRKANMHITCTCNKSNAKFSLIKIICSQNSEFKVIKQYIKNT